MQRSMAMFRLIWKERLNFKTAKLTAKESRPMVSPMQSHRRKETFPASSPSSVPRRMPPQR